MEINRAISMCGWTMTLLVSLDVCTHVTNKFADHGPVMWK